MKQITLLLILAFSVTTASLAQDTLRPRHGVTAGIMINRHEADFRALPGVPNCCSGFESGSGMGIFGEVRYELPLAPSMLLSLGVGYAGHSAILLREEPVAIATGESVTEATFEHSITASLATIGADAGVAYRIADGIFLTGRIRGGSLLSSTFEQKEMIVSASNQGTFLDSTGADSQSRTRNEVSGDIPEAASLLLHAGIGIRYELPINADRTMLLVPQASYMLGLNDISSVSWRGHGIQLGIGLMFSPAPPLYIWRDTTYVRDTTVVAVERNRLARVEMIDRTETLDRVEGDTTRERFTVRESYRSEIPRRSRLVVTAKAMGFEKGRELPSATLRIEEFLRTTSHPLLGYLFFDSGSSSIPERYNSIDRAAADSFRPQELFEQDALGVSHNILNLIGYNMRQYSDARLTLTGTNSNVGAETGNRELSRQRAEQVRRYLIESWGIAGDRLTVEARDLPATPSNPKTAEGAEENRRVEIRSSNPAVTDLFIANDTTRSVSPPGIRIRVGSESSEGVASWRAVARQRGRDLKEFSGTGEPPSTLDWDLSSDERSVPRFGDPVDIEVTLIDKSGERESTHTTLPTSVITVAQKQASGSEDFAVEKYNLVLFPFGSSAITAEHRRTIDQIRSRLSPRSRIMVEGFTDQSGDASANRRLALARARSTAAALGRGDAGVAGIGEDRLLHPNDLPEGRFYCRTVQITVRTPVR